MSWGRDRTVSFTPRCLGTFVEPGLELALSELLGRDLLLKVLRVDDVFSLRGNFLISFAGAEDLLAGISGRSEESREDVRGW